MKTSLPTLLLIDIQKGMDECDYYGGKRNNPEAEKQMAIILKYWRNHQGPLYHIKHNSTAMDSPLRPNYIGNDFKEEVAPLPHEWIIAKSVNSAFIGTDLLERLQAQNVEQLVIVGLTTDHCISTTTRMAGNLGFQTFLISDATATFDKCGPNGELYPAKLVHEFALASLHNEFCEVVTTDELLSQIKLKSS